MPPRKAKKKPGQTWSGLDEGDITGADEAEDAQLIEFGRRSKPPEETEEKERRCPRKPKR